MHRDPSTGSCHDHCRIQVLELCRIALRGVSEMDARSYLGIHKFKPSGQLTSSGKPTSEVRSDHSMSNT